MHMHAINVKVTKYDDRRYYVIYYDWPQRTSFRSSSWPRRLRSSACLQGLFLDPVWQYLR